MMEESTLVLGDSVFYRTGFYDMERRVDSILLYVDCSMDLILIRFHCNQ